jgi:hypothetical protein
MKINLEHPYATDVDSLFELFKNTDFIGERYAQTGGHNVELLELSDKGDRVLIRLQRDMDVEVPAFLRKFMHPTTRVVQTEKWRTKPGGPYVNDMQVEIHGTPVSLQINMQLLAKGKGCVNRVEIEARCNIPLIGSKIADFVGQDAARTAEAEYRFILGYLKRS